MANYDDSAGCLIILCLGWVLAMWCYLSPPWHSKLWYATHYGVEYSSVTILKKPSDCEFMAAPIGDKHCHYDREVATVQTAKNLQGDPIVSCDGGKTWTLNMYGVSASVFVSWAKVDKDKN